MAISAIRTVIIYIFIIAAMRIMGKRQLGELQPVELVVTLLISDLAAVPMQESGMPLLNGLIPIVVLVALELLLSGLMLKSSGFSKLISGNPIVIIRDGKLDQKALKRLRLTVEDLMETLRQQNAFDIREIEYAIAETNGKISLFMKPASRPVTAGDVKAASKDTGVPIVVVSDGKLVDWGLKMSGLDEDWVRSTLKKDDCPLDDVVVMTADKSRQYFVLRNQQLKEKKGAAS